jgi:protein-tyrosine phosphatase
MSLKRPTRVLFVCLGNICRSPTAEGVFRALVEERGLSHRIEIDSCGTSAWHVGEAPDSRSAREAARRGYDLSALRGRQVASTDFERFDYILAMDRANLSELELQRPAGYEGHLGLLLAFASEAELEEVPDPYYGGEGGFSHVLDLIEDASRGLLADITAGARDGD